MGAATLAAVTVGAALVIPHLVTPDLVVKSVAQQSKIDAVVPGIDRKVTVVVYSASMNRQIPVVVLKPRDESKPSPVLYLLNG